jgi:hypothetical protein
MDDSLWLAVAARASHGVGIRISLGTPPRPARSAGRQQCSPPVAGPPAAAPATHHQRAQAKYPPRYHFGKLGFACRRAQNSDYACDLTRSRCHQEPFRFGVLVARAMGLSSCLVVAAGCRVRSSLCMTGGGSAVYWCRWPDIPGSAAGAACLLGWREPAEELGGLGVMRLPVRSGRRGGRTGRGQQAPGWPRDGVARAVPGVGVVQEGMPVRVAVLARSCWRCPGHAGGGPDLAGACRDQQGRAGDLLGGDEGIRVPGAGAGATGAGQRLSAGQPGRPAGRSGTQIAVSIAGSLPRDMPVTAAGGAGEGSAARRISGAAAKCPSRMPRSCRGRAGRAKQAADIAVIPWRAQRLSGMGGLAAA